jgi:hypothetical protein
VHRLAGVLGRAALGLDRSNLLSLSLSLLKSALGMKEPDIDASTTGSGGGVGRVGLEGQTNSEEWRRAELAKQYMRLFFDSAAAQRLKSTNLFALGCMHWYRQVIDPMF